MEGSNQHKPNKNPPKGRGLIKSRWNPTEEQIFILESIFQSGIVNPKKDEIVKIRELVEKFGAVGDTNIFYWYQNRRSRSRRRQRQVQANLRNELAASNISTPTIQITSIPPSVQVEPTFSSSSSSDTTPCFDPLNPLTYLISSVDDVGVGVGGFSSSPYEGGITGAGIGSGGEAGCFYTNSNQLVDLAEMEQCQNVTSSMNNQEQQQGQNVISNMNYQEQQQGQNVTSNMNYQQQEPELITVYIDGVPTVVPNGSFDMTNMFGPDAVLVHSSGEPIPFNEYGFSLHSLQIGESYFLV